ncbi:hypothetical protein [uncultured Desulfosarcina sp.]|uniref:hypothetical protein n=1 Tax=uncultured Desulfosarcina sp. TaxID=218289 RepID=UPI0029C99FD0|nr:hypothetical protein [uncultured Desulfosarcina sp.]
MDIQYPIAGVIVLVGAVAFLKTFDFLAAQSVKRLLEIGEASRADKICGSDTP